ncbi:hypothetical protein AG1IA_09227 [Rhizoctonia solani AG-1 IA]|uniref:Uncharacterized protein n=1 Tax=Thanatephorus cucumeris (strain AG1-IA) TaxID=983506 RepID=L8WFK4_THACA|nr:hypothetical protein AG1IA_09227 [Rhizoctonia solani AG-1 IA]
MILLGCSVLVDEWAYLLPGKILVQAAGNDIDGYLYYFALGEQAVETCSFLELGANDHLWPYSCSLSDLGSLERLYNFRRTLT